LPRVVCGSSAGSIVGSVLCTQKADEVGSQLEELCKGDLSVFQGFDEIQGPAGMAFNLARGRCAFNIHNLCRVMKRLLGNVTFREAYNYSGRILNIHVSSRDKFSLPRLLNYQTSPNVVVWTAVASSCALPGVFEPPGLRAKDPETGEITLWGHLDDKWIDGSIEGDLPARTMERLFNVNNFIVSQVNPHVQPFLDGNVDTPLYTVSAQSILQKPIVKKGLRLAQASCIYALDGLMDRGFDYSLVKMGHSVLGQKYHGDITILPDISWVPWLKVLANPELDFMVKAVRSGEKATWPKLDRVRNNVAIELSLNAAIKHIHSARIRPAQRIEPRARKALPSARSDYQLTQLWQRPTSSRSMRPIPSRRATHRPTRSWYDPNDVPNFLPVHHTIEHMLSSSDEARSELSSPVTSYEDEDFTDVTARNSAEVSRPETPRANAKSVSLKDDADSRRFLSQPPSPTTSFRGSSYFAAEPAAMITAQPAPHSSHLKRAMTAFSNLQMTSTPMAFQGTLGRKKQRQ
jgi:TAG lipase/steryl ester hydrolase/phospholipase A2/LPA acyltransferase